MKKILLIIGSVRANGKGHIVANWLIKNNKNKNLSFEIADLNKLNIVHYNEPSSPRRSSDYLFEATKNWSELVKSADGVIFITPEYNGYFTGAMKDAIDYLYYEWEDKPYSIVGYGGSGASHAIKHLDNLVQTAFRMKRIPADVRINRAWEAISEEDINSDFIDGDLNEMLNEF